MRYSQLVMGLLIGTILGGAVASTQHGSANAAGMTKSEIQAIVRETIAGEGKLIIESVQKFQESERNQATSSATEALKDKAVHDGIYNDAATAFVGPKDSKKIFVEFFDYNCPACKMQFTALDELIKKDDSVKVIFHEYPIFGEVSETNAKIGLAVFHHYPEKYLAFHGKMMSNEGRTDEKAALGFAKELGMDLAKIKDFAASNDASAVLDKNRALGDKLNIQGTPTVIVGDEVVPHAVSFEDIEAKLSQMD